jgi:hypothetical protein
MPSGMRQPNFGVKTVMARSDYMESMLTMDLRRTLSTSRDKTPSTAKQECISENIPAAYHVSLVCRWCNVVHSADDCFEDEISFSRSLE